MPVVDWTRTNLNYTLPNNARALRFEMSDFAAYDVYILQRPGAEQPGEIRRQRRSAKARQVEMPVQSRRVRVTGVIE